MARSGRRFAAAAVLGLLLPACVSAQSAGGSARGVSRAVLARGSEAVKGLPGFGKNALPAVYGEYRLEGAAETSADALRVWMTDEALYLSPADWRAERAAGRQAYRAAAAPLLLFDRPFSAGGQGAEPRLWTVVAEAPDAAFPAPADRDRFLRAFLDRLAYFLSIARSRTDVSFPAVVEF